MDNLVEYLDESLVPLEEKIRTYLDVEHNMRLLEVELLSLQSIRPDFSPNSQDAEQTAPQGNLIRRLNDKEKRLAELVEYHKELRQEVISMLPAQNRLFELNVGYGPTRVGYFTVDPETLQPLPEAVLRIVH
ncbi:hypothetical protein ACFS7Z_03520 [Pontibacter toksunensis]|uniref:FlgN protein n=1 Tax=Pontibacter toksunensis TaxID=1332631 RepID=A0ABW6BSM4_9BACT